LEFERECTCCVGLGWQSHALEGESKRGVGVCQRNHRVIDAYPCISRIIYYVCMEITFRTAIGKKESHIERSSSWVTNTRMWCVTSVLKTCIGWTIITRYCWPHKRSYFCCFTVLYGVLRGKPLSVTCQRHLFTTLQVLMFVRIIVYIAILSLTAERIAAPDLCLDFVCRCHLLRHSTDHKKDSIMQTAKL